MKLRIAACQFPVQRGIEQNQAYILRQMASAASRGADVALFPEASLGGYAGVDFPSFRGYDWPLLIQCTQRVMDEARQQGIWVVLGSNHRLTGKHKPHNCLYIISDRGQVVDRYDKLFCTGGPDQMDMRHYSPGSHFAKLTIKGVRCGFLICHDWRYPEVYRRYKQLGVDLIMQSWYDGGLNRTQWRDTGKMLGQVIPATAQGHAACNHLWICGTNTSKPQSCFGGFLIQPDGQMVSKAARNRPSVHMCTVDTEAPLDDPARHWRKDAIKGKLHGGKKVGDPRSADRKCV